LPEEKDERMCVKKIGSNAKANEPGPNPNHGLALIEFVIIDQESLCVGAISSGNLDCIDVI